VRSREEVTQVLALAAAGLNSCEIARRTGIPRGTVRDWRLGRRPNLDQDPANDGRRASVALLDAFVGPKR
jgi:transposase